MRTFVSSSLILTFGSLVKADFYDLECARNNCFDQLKTCSEDQASLLSTAPIKRGYCQTVMLCVLKEETGESLSQFTDEVQKGHEVGMNAETDPGYCFGTQDMEMSKAEKDLESCVQQHSCKHPSKHPKKVAPPKDIALVADSISKLDPACMVENCRDAVSGCDNDEDCKAVFQCMALTKEQESAVNCLKGISKIKESETAILTCAKDKNCVTSMKAQEEKKTTSLLASKKDVDKPAEHKDEKAKVDVEKLDDKSAAQKSDEKPKVEKAALVETPKIERIKEPLKVNMDCMKENCRSNSCDQENGCKTLYECMEKPEEQCLQDNGNNAEQLNSFSECARKSNCYDGEWRVLEEDVAAPKEVKEPVIEEKNKASSSSLIETVKLPTVTFPDPESFLETESQMTMDQRVNEASAKEKEAEAAWVLSRERTNKLLSKVHDEMSLLNKDLAKTTAQQESDLKLLQDNRKKENEQLRKTEDQLQHMAQQAIHAPLVSSFLQRGNDDFLAPLREAAKQAHQFAADVRKHQLAFEQMEKGQSFTPGSLLQLSDSDRKAMEYENAANVNSEKADRSLSLAQQALNNLNKDLAEQKRELQDEEARTKKEEEQELSYLSEPASLSFLQQTETYDPLSPQALQEWKDHFEEELQKARNAAGIKTPASFIQEIQPSFTENNEKLKQDQRQVERLEQAYEQEMANLKKDNEELKAEARSEMEKADALKAKLASEASSDKNILSGSFLQRGNGLQLGHYDPQKEEESIRELERKWQRDAAKLATEDKSFLEDDTNAQLNSMIESQKEKERIAENELDKMKTKLSQDIEMMHKDVAAARANADSTASASFLEGSDGAPNSESKPEEKTEEKENVSEEANAENQKDESRRLDEKEKEEAVVPADHPEEKSTEEVQKEVNEKSSGITVVETARHEPNDSIEQAKETAEEIKEQAEDVKENAEERKKELDEKSEQENKESPAEDSSESNENKELVQTEKPKKPTAQPTTSFLQVQRHVVKPSSLLQISSEVVPANAAEKAGEKSLEEAEALLKKMDDVLKGPEPSASSSFLQSAEKDPAELALDKAERDLEKLQEELRQESSNLSGASSSVGYLSSANAS